MCILNLSGARAVLGNAIGIAPKDNIFKKYIEIKLQLGNMDRLWIGYAKFEASAIEDVEQQEELPEDLKEERAMLLEEWLNMESGFGELGDIELVRVKLPKKLKKRRQIEIDDGPVGCLNSKLHKAVFDAVGLDYKSDTVIVDATTAATPDVHAVWNSTLYLVLGSKGLSLESHNPG
ncbi:crooked neck-like protein 1 [Tanacetum coccineum]